MTGTLRELSSATYSREAARHLEVHLDGAALPRATEAVLKMIFDLGTVEGAFTLKNFILDAESVKTLHQGMLGLVPDGVLTDAHFGARGDLVAISVKPKSW